MKFFISDWLSLSSSSLSAFFRQVYNQLRGFWCKEQTLCLVFYVWVSGNQHFPPKQIHWVCFPKGISFITSLIPSCMWLFILKRILLRLLHLVQAVHGGHHLLQAAHPAPGFLFRAGNQVQVLAVALEHDAEAAALHLLLRAFFQSLWLTANTDCWDVIEWNWGQMENINSRQDTSSQEGCVLLIKNTESQRCNLNAKFYFAR